MRVGIVSRLEVRILHAESPKSSLLVRFRSGTHRGALVRSRDTGTVTTDPLVLFVEDDSELRTVVGRGLREEGFLVETAATGAESLERIGMMTPDVLIVDVGLPDTDGRDLCQALRARGSRDTGPVPDCTRCARRPDRRLRRRRRRLPGEAVRVRRARRSRAGARSARRRRTSARVRRAACRPGRAHIDTRARRPLR